MHLLTLNLFTGILVAKKSLFKTINACEPDGFFASLEQNKVSIMFVE